MKLTQRSFAKRALVVGLIAGSSILAASSFAMPGGDSAAGEGCGHHGQKASGNWQENRAKHLSDLKEKLQLTPQQTAAWDAFAGASGKGMHQGMDKPAMQGGFDKLTTPQRLDKMMAMSDARRAKMAERAQAVKAFYAQLTAEQKKVFDAEANPGFHRGHGQHRHAS